MMPTNTAPQLVQPSRYLAEDGIAVTISDVAIEKMAQASAGAPHETGGILVGSYGRDGLSATVADAWTAPEDSKASRFTFSRGTRAMAERLDDAWEQGTHYVGEWHFHPGDSTPSRQDHRTMRTLARNPALQCQAPILVVIGVEGPPSVFVYPEGKRGIKLAPEQNQ